MSNEYKHILVKPHAHKAFKSAAKKKGMNMTAFLLLVLEDYKKAEGYRR